MGFEIGLHFDPASYNCLDETIVRQKFNDEINLLSSLIDKDLRSVSIHIPSLQDELLLFDKYINAYNRSIFAPDYYISDSQIKFRGKSIYEFVENIKYRTIQILLHPMHYSDNGMDYLEVVQEHVLNYLQKIDKVFCVNSTYRAQTTDGYGISYDRGLNADNS